MLKPNLAKHFENINLFPWQRVNNGLESELGSERSYNSKLETLSNVCKWFCLPQYLKGASKRFLSLRFEYILFYCYVFQKNRFSILGNTLIYMITGRYYPLDKNKLLLSTLHS